MSDQPRTDKTASAAPTPEAKALLDAALAIAGRRRETLLSLRDALQQGDTKEVYRLAGKLCGLHETGYRVN